jgi:catechol 2,3-dioxygenase-like lactoylglutathione lyase family enzyme
MMKKKFSAGRNIAMKVPSHEYSRTVEFYKDIIGFPFIDREPGGVIFQFGDKRLWIDREEHISQAEIWLEIVTNDVKSAEKYLKNKGVDRRDRIEELPEGYEGFWITNPADIIHLVSSGSDR